MTANTPQSRKGKGREFQQAIRKDLIATLGIEEGDILSTATGQGGCDLYLSPAAREKFPFGVEAKRQEKLSIPDWWRQCEKNAKAANLTPLLIFRKNRGDALAVLKWEDLLALLELIQRGEINGLPLTDFIGDVLPLGRDEP